LFLIVPDKKKMSFSETIPEDDILQEIYEKIIFDEFYKRTRQLKQENNKRYVFIEVQDYL
jgi:hypothetical protein